MISVDPAWFVFWSDFRTSSLYLQRNEENYCKIHFIKRCKSYIEMARYLKSKCTSSRYSLLSKVLSVHLVNMLEVRDI